MSTTNRTAQTESLYLQLLAQRSWGNKANDSSLPPLPQPLLYKIRNTNKMPNTNILWAEKFVANDNKKFDELYLLYFHKYDVEH